MTEEFYEKFVSLLQPNGAFWHLWLRGWLTLRCMVLLHQEIANAEILPTADHMIENFGSDGPRSFDGDGITLYEVATANVPERALRLLNTMVDSFMDSRVEALVRTNGAFPAVPRQPQICGGMIEFKFLSYELDP